MRYCSPDVDWYYASGRLRFVRQGVTFGRTVFLQLLLGIQHIVNPLSCSNVQMAEILKWGKIVFECVHDVLMLKILKGDEDCWSTKSNPDWRQTDLWYITKANRLPWGLNFAHFLVLFIRIYSIFEDVVVFWWSISARPNITHIHQRRSAKKRSESVRRTWLAFWEVSCLQQCVIVWQVKSVLKGVSEKCWSVWEFVLKCWTWAIKWVWG